TQDYSVVSVQYDGFLSPPVATATVNGVRIRVMFDTGSPRSMLFLAAAARAGVRPSDPGVTSAGYTAGVAARSQFNIWRARFASFKLGDEEIKNTPLLIGDMQLPGVDMLVGADFFLSHRVYVSNTQHKIYFTYNGGPVFNLDTDTPAATAAADADAPQDAAGLARRAAASAARRNFPDAIADLTRAMALAPNDPDYVYDRAGRTGQSSAAARRGRSQPGHKDEARRYPGPGGARGDLLGEGATDGGPRLPGDRQSPRRQTVRRPIGSRRGLCRHEYAQGGPDPTRSVDRREPAR